MIEIAISLAVIGFALVAIIGILPTGMNVQKENREETIIGQDASVFMDAIRSGAKGMDDLTNYVVAITNWQTTYNFKGKPIGANPVALFYTYTNSSVVPPMVGPFLLTNGARIVGLLSTPKYVPATNNAKALVCSNYVVAYVRALSGPASEKFPQTNDAIRELAFNYRLASDVVPYTSYDPNWTNYNDPSLYAPTTNFAEITLRSNYWMVAKNTQENLYDIRLIFRWPLLANGVGNGRQSFRTLASGHLQVVGQQDDLTNPTNTYFFEPRNYVRVP
jgi:type II secretory pathway pseudopilin PulG